MRRKQVYYGPGDEKKGPLLFSESLPVLDLGTLLPHTRDSLVPQTGDSSLDPGLRSSLRPSVFRGKCTWCSEGGSELSTVVKSLAIKPADTTPQRSAILDVFRLPGAGGGANATALHAAASLPCSAL